MARPSATGLIGAVIAVPFVAVIVGSVAPNEWSHITASFQEAGTPAGAARDRLADLHSNHRVDTAKTSGQDDPANWRPADRAAWCDYAIAWINAHDAVTDGQASALVDMLDSCHR